MEGEGDEGTHPLPKWSCRLTNHAQFPSTSTKVSIFTNPSLPQELITAILVRLPVKYILQFKCVSKDWLSLISSPEFVKTHLSFSANDYTCHSVMLNSYLLPFSLKRCYVSTLFNQSVIEAFDLDFPMKSPNICTVIYIVGSVNGLICVRIGYNELIMWNPSTRKFKQVPTQLSDYAYKYGFGYDEVHDDYNIVGLLDSIKNGYVFGEIYSLKNDSWRRLDDFQGAKLTNSSTKLVNGKLHWVTYGDNGYGIVFVDLVDEKCGKVEPPCYGEGGFSLELGVLGSEFSVLCNYHQQDCTITHSDMWVMKEYGVKESWKKLYTIKYPIYPEAVSTPICMSNKGEILLWFESNLTVYNPEDKSFKYLEITNINGGFEVLLYFESLVCPF